MHGRSASVPRDPQRNLQVVVVGAGLLYFAWSWVDFSGPFRWFVDLQLRLLGRYGEPAPAFASAVLMIALVGLVIVALHRALPGLSQRTADAIVAVVFVAASVAALVQVGRLWHEAATMPRLADPVRTVDLGSIGDAAPPLGHVRIVGVPDRERLVIGETTGRFGMSRWEAWMPLIARQSPATDAPVQVVATARKPDAAAAAKAIVDDPEGLLLSGSVDTRTIYQARQAGLAMAPHPLALYRDEAVRFDKIADAALLGGFLVLFWGMAVYGWVRDRRSTRPVSLAGAEPAAPAPPAPAPAALAPVEIATGADPVAESSLTRIGTGMSIAAVVAGGLLWTVYGFFPSGPGLVGYAAAAVLFLLSLVAMGLGQRGEVSPGLPGPSMAPHASDIEMLTPPPGAGLLCVMRDEPGFSSTSYKRVDVDGARVADLKANRYVVVALWPGPHTLAVNTRISLTSDTVVRFALAAGEVVVYRMNVAFAGPLRLERVDDEAAARSALARLKRVASAPRAL